MMDEKGGPAFPQPRYVNDDSCTPPGMSLRDWFAGKEQSYPPASWIQSFYGSELNGWHDLKGVNLTDALSRWRYQCADAMLKIRDE